MPNKDDELYINVEEENQEEEQLEEQDQLDEEQIEESSQEQEEENLEEEQLNNEEDEEGEPEKKTISRRQELAIQRILQRGTDQEQPRPKQNSKPNVRDRFDADDSVYEQLEQDQEEYGQHRYNEGLEQAKSIRWETMLHIDAPKVESKHSFMDKNSAEFKPAAANAINTWYVQMSGYDNKSGMVANPNIRYSEFVDGIMELANEIATQKTEQSRKNITRQAAKTGIRPDGSASKTKRPEDMSIEELNEFINKGLNTR